jgi:putative hydrolase of HD superfamily
MLLIHDIIEIDAGDSPIYDAAAQEGKEERERLAAERIFGLLPQSDKDELIALWLEFEEHQTNDARFARSMDRLSPLLYNFHTKGVRWAKFGVNADDVLKRLVVIADGSKELWTLGESIIRQAVERGYLKPGA